jgi:hypothetical protein
MDKGPPHRISRLLRIALSGILLLQGVGSPWMVGNLYAQNQDSMSVQVTPVSYKAPASINDLLAAANPAVEGLIALSWTAPQGNEGGTPMPNWPVAAYQVHFATYSIANMGGDASAWWTATAASEVLLQAPAFPPKNPGELEAYALSTLTPGAHYYFSLKSISRVGVSSPIDLKSQTAGQQANAIATKFATSAGTPKRPNGLSMNLAGAQFTFHWHPVTLDTEGNPVTIGQYIVNRYDSIGAPPTASFNLAGNATSLTDTVNNQTYYYRVMAMTPTGVPSGFSDYVDSSLQTNRYVIAASEMTTRIVIPGSLATELNFERNGSSDDYEILAVHKPENENETTLKSYLFEVRDARTGVPVLGFHFSEATAEVEVSYALSLPTVGVNTSLHRAVTNAGQQAAAIAQVISLYWFNGDTFIRLGGTVLLQDQALMVTSRNLGLYELRAVSMPVGFALTRGSPYPRVITPNGAENRRVFWFFDNPAGENVTGTIYDIRGAKVRELVVNNQSPTANSLVWDGHDNQGAVVPSGVYLYKIQAGKEKVTGTVVVAR